MNSLLTRMLRRLFLVVALVLPFFALNGQYITKSFVPLYVSAFNSTWLMDDFQLVSIDAAQKGFNQVLELKVRWKHETVINGHTIYPHPGGIATASTMIWHALQIPAIALIFILVWPSKKFFRGIPIELLTRLAILMPSLFFIVSIDMPLFLSGSIWAMVYDALSPGSENWTVRWMSFAEGGGHYLVGLLLAMFCVCISKHIQTDYVAP